MFLNDSRPAKRLENNSPMSVRSFPQKGKSGRMEWENKMSSPVIIFQLPRW
jgi:hypothetical protein